MKAVPSILDSPTAACGPRELGSRAEVVHVTLVFLLPQVTREHWQWTCCTLPPVTRAPVSQAPRPLPAAAESIHLKTPGMAEVPTRPWLPLHPALPPAVVEAVTRETLSWQKSPLFWCPRHHWGWTVSSKVSITLEAQAVITKVKLVDRGGRRWKMWIFKCNQRALG